MPMIASEKKLKKMVEPLLQDGESISAITFQGGFKKLCLAATDNHRLADHHSALFSGARQRSPPKSTSGI